MPNRITTIRANIFSSLMLFRQRLRFRSVLGSCGLLALALCCWTFACRMYTCTHAYNAHDTHGTLSENRLYYTVYMLGLGVVMLWLLGIKLREREREKHASFFLKLLRCCCCWVVLDVLAARARWLSVYHKPNAHRAYIYYSTVHSLSVKTPSSPQPSPPPSPPPPSTSFLVPS